MLTKNCLTRIWLTSHLRYFSLFTCREPATTIYWLIEFLQEENPNSPLLSAASTLSKKGSITSQDICRLVYDTNFTNSLTKDFYLLFSRICHCEAEFESPLVAPCCCAGSLKYVHQGCLQRWVQSSDMKNCELCKYPFIMQTKIKPFKEVCTCIVSKFMCELGTWLLFTVGKARYVFNGTSKTGVLGDFSRRSIYVRHMVALRVDWSIGRRILLGPIAVAFLDKVGCRGNWFYRYKIGLSLSF